MTSLLPPALLKYFAPRPPIPYFPPIDRGPGEHLMQDITGLAGVLGLCGNHDKDYSVTETVLERKKRMKAEREESNKAKKELLAAQWDPSKDEKITSEPFNTLFVGRLSYETSEETLKKEFESFGPVKSIRIVLDSVKNKPKGYAFIEFKREEDMKKAYRKASGSKIDGRRILVDCERGRTVKDWKPRKLGGGLGLTRAAGRQAERTISSSSANRISRDDYRPTGVARTHGSQSSRHGSDRDRHRSRPTLSLPTAGRSGSLTSEQENTLAEFKRVLDAANITGPYDDNIFLRFLRARKFDLDASVKMFTDYHNWRADYNVESLRDEFELPEYPIVRAFYPRYYHRTDKLGRPVYYENLGELNVTQLFAVCTTEKMLRHHVYEYEKLVNYRLPACSKAAGTYIEQSCTILDLKGVSLSSFSSVYNTVKEVSSIAQNYYPEMLGKMFIINSPMLFTAVWSLVKPLLDEVTVSKIEILGSSYKAKLLEVIDENNLPAAYGGKCSCPGGCQASDVGPWNDMSLQPDFPKKEWERFNIEFQTGQCASFKF
ncbi:MAG: hypothetical protein SGCHY_000890 [Lobulomycetales sp.]